MEKNPTKTAVTSRSSSLATAVTLTESTYGYSIKATADDIMVPDGFYLTSEERSVLEILQDRLRDGFVRRPEPSAWIYKQGIIHRYHLLTLHSGPGV